MDLIEDLVKERFGTAVARELSRKPGLFEHGKLYPRSHITETLRDEFVRRGGDDDTRKDAVARVLKKWLSGPSCPFRKEMRGRYRFLGFDATIGQALGIARPDSAKGEAPRTGAPSPVQEIGAGSYEVYAWYLPRYQATSENRWPIKIGKAGPDGLSRRLSDFHENLPEEPCYLLRIRCANDREARDREALLHAWFRSRGQELNDLPGKEWFLTNPREIADAVGNIIGANALPGSARDLEIEDVINDAFKDVTADDWARLPADLTDRLDDYLYGRDRT
ncbi:MAG: GIY-YIG nuclease family protein [Bryobacterales bacterium]|nr:GIY-YIG nuclease family protein [Bryobacterales bacterium]